LIVYGVKNKAKMKPADNFDLKKYLTEGRLFEDENLPSREEMFNDFEKMAKDIEAKIGAKIQVIKSPNRLRFHVDGDMIKWWGGQLDLFVDRKNPSPQMIKRAYDLVNEWADWFPEQYADYLSWKEKGEEAFSQEAERKRKLVFTGNDSTVRSIMKFINMYW
jgi:hypothetical protein